MKIILKFLAILLFSFAVVNAWAYLTNPHTLPLKHVKIVGRFAHIESQPLQALLAPYLNAGFLTADFSLLRQCLLGMPWVDAIHIERVWPDTVVIHILEQQPIARWGSDALLAVNGQVFSPPIETFPKNLPLFQGIDRMEAPKVLQLYKQITVILEPLQESIASLDGSEKNSWNLITGQGMRLALSKLSAITELNAFLWAYPKLMLNKKQQPRSVDLRYPNGFAVAW